MAVPTFHAAELAAATGGVWRGNRSPSNVVRGVVTDTRRSATGALFLALVGERFDAHDFLRDAISGGCAALCIEKNGRQSCRRSAPSRCWRWMTR